MTFSPNTHELAWAAGFFDGEGTVMWRGRKRAELSLVVGQSDIRPLRRFQAAVGGLGTVRGPYFQKNPKHKPYWVFGVGSHKNTQAVVAMLWNWLSEPKREQALEAITAALPHYKFRAEMGKGNSRFTVAEVVDLRARHAEALVGRQRVQRGWIVAEAARLGVSPATISNIIKGRGYVQKNNIG